MNRNSVLFALVALLVLLFAALPVLAQDIDEGDDGPAATAVSTPDDGVHIPNADGETPVDELPTGNSAPAANLFTVLANFLNNPWALAFLFVSVFSLLNRISDGRLVHIVKDLVPQTFIGQFLPAIREAYYRGLEDGLKQASKSPEKGDDLPWKVAIIASGGTIIENPDGSYIVKWPPAAPPEPTVNKEAVPAAV